MTHTTRRHCQAGRRSCVTGPERREVTVTVSAPPDNQAMIRDALTQVRMARHHRDCRCGIFQRHWCSPEEKLWCRSVDRLIETIRDTR
jgi:hypothetical protein